MAFVPYQYDKPFRNGKAAKTTIFNHLQPRKKVWTHFEKKLIYELEANKIIMTGALIFSVTSYLNNDHSYVPWEGIVQLFQVGGGDLLPNLSRSFFSPILKMIPSRLLLAISKRFELQQRDCNRIVDLLTQINLLFLFFFQLLWKQRYHWQKVCPNFFTRQ